MRPFATLRLNLLRSAPAPVLQRPLTFIIPSAGGCKQSEIGRRAWPSERILPSTNKKTLEIKGEAVDKEGSTAFFVEFGIKQFRRKVFICSGRTHPGNFNPKQST